MIIFQKSVFFSRNKRVFLDLKEIKLNSNLIWMSGTMWFILYILIRAPLQPYRSSFVFIYSYLLSYLMHRKSSTYVRHNEIQIWTQQCKTAKKCRLIHTVPSFFLWGTCLSQYSFFFFFNLSSPIKSHYSSFHQCIICINTLLCAVTGGGALQGTHRTLQQLWCIEGTV